VKITRERLITAFRLSASGPDSPGALSGEKAVDLALEDLPQEEMAPFLWDEVVPSLLGLLGALREEQDGHLSEGQAIIACFMAGVTFGRVLEQGLPRPENAAGLDWQGWLDGS
jgi:hypothetical protein